MPNRQLLLLPATLFAILAFEGPASAELFPNPQIEYSADKAIQTEDATIQQHFYYTPTKERTETLDQTGTGASPDKPVQILRKDSHTMWQVIASRKMYTEYKMGAGNPAAQSPGNLDDWDIDESVVGQDTIDGTAVTKMKTIATATDGSKYGGFSWRTREGIVMKMDVISKDGDGTHRIKIELRNLKIGRQDPALFEVPADYKKLDMNGMMSGFMNGAAGPKPPRPGADVGHRKPSGDSETGEKPSDKSPMQSASDLLKGILKR